MGRTIPSFTSRSDSSQTSRVKDALNRFGLADVIDPSDLARSYYFSDKSDLIELVNRNFEVQRQCGVQTSQLRLEQMTDLSKKYGLNSFAESGQLKHEYKGNSLLNSAPYSVDSKINRILDAQNYVLRQGIDGELKPRPDLEKTFCNHAVVGTLERAGVPTIGLRDPASRDPVVALSHALQKGTYSANRICNELERNWVSVPKSSGFYSQFDSVQHMANLGILPVGCVKGPEHGHVVTVRPLEDPYESDLQAPFLNNVGSLGKVGVLPCEDARKGLGYYVHPQDVMARVNELSNHVLGVDKLCYGLEDKALSMKFVTDIVIADRELSDPNNHKFSPMTDMFLKGGVLGVSRVEDSLEYFPSPFTQLRTELGCRFGAPR